MKLFLTSAGLTTQTLKNRFIQLLPSPPAQTSVAVIITASKAERDTAYLEQSLERLRETGVTNISRIDIADQEEDWKPILLNADVVWIEGGSTFYLLGQFRATKLVDTIAHLCQGKLFVGVSAGSIITTPSIAIAGVEPADANTVGLTDFSALNWVDFEVSPHTPDIVPLPNVEAYARKCTRPLYAYDDTVALVVTDGTVEIVGEGFCKLYDRTRV